MVCHPGLGPHKREEFERWRVFWVWHYYRVARWICILNWIMAVTTHNRMTCQIRNKKCRNWGPVQSHLPPNVYINLFEYTHTHTHHMHVRAHTQPNISVVQKAAYHCISARSIILRPPIFWFGHHNPSPSPTHTDTPTLNSKYTTRSGNPFWNYISTDFFFRWFIKGNNTIQTTDTAFRVANCIMAVSNAAYFHVCVCMWTNQTAYPPLYHKIN